MLESRQELLQIANRKWHGLFEAKGVLDIVDQALHHLLVEQGDLLLADGLLDARHGHLVAELEGRLGGLELWVRAHHGAYQPLLVLEDAAGDAPVQLRLVQAPQELALPCVHQRRAPGVALQRSARVPDAGLLAPHEQVERGHAVVALLRLLLLVHEVAHLLPLLGRASELHRHVRLALLRHHHGRAREPRLLAILLQSARSARDHQSGAARQQRAEQDAEQRGTSR
mmetsp:Transcript_11499/g.42931  ORF Transcript_11499/g.42931 Transcript_11499/m.42931 type:complete len:227 (+) Transcript_11499:86-766(+)|eukprot:scaffold1154_cov310-Pinguiococcus_pyrenoidosus.AAC.27